VVATANKAAAATVTFESPLGSILATASERGITRLWFLDESEKRPPGASGDSRVAFDHIKLLQRELTAYFEGRLREFTVPLDPQGTLFQRKVWDRLRSIPCGQTRSYSDIAGELGNPLGVRAVGTANGRNPISILIPCHRVIAADGSLGGYGGGLWRKQALLDLERGTPASLFAKSST